MSENIYLITIIQKDSNGKEKNIASKLCNRFEAYSFIEQQKAETKPYKIIDKKKHWEWTS
jgi:hypothetical protein